MNDVRHLVIDVRGALPVIDGIHTYLRNTVPSLCAAGERSGDFRTTLLVYAEMEPFWSMAVPAARLVASPTYPNRPWQNWAVARQLAPLRPDLYFYPAHDPPLFVPAPLVFTIHDVALFRIRPYFERLDRAKRTYLRAIITAGLCRARAVFADSEATRWEIGELFGERFLPKVHVAPLGISGVARRPCDESTLNCLLYVGTDRPHKNLHRLIRGYARAREQASDLPRLEIVGWMRRPQELAKTIGDCALDQHVVVRGHVGDIELESCYARAFALLLPSLAEGFGLPILEAMVRGVPVITSNVSACAEVAGAAALTVDTFDVEAIATGIVQLFRDRAHRSELIRRGFARAATFSWQRTVDLTFSVIRDSLYCGKPPNMQRAYEAASEGTGQSPLG
jgi:glycosyltransferase involved in cell wall biosynthesis